MAVQAAASGAGSVTVVEPLAERRALAVGLGADRAVPPGDAAALEVDVASSARGPGRYPASARSVVTTVSAMATRMAVALISPGWHGSPAVKMSRSRLRRAPAGGISPRNWPWPGSPIAQDLTWRRPQCLQTTWKWRHRRPSLASRNVR
jgi:hypothetical protein